jgi:zinc transport system substrate-binding protein
MGMIYCDGKSFFFWRGNLRKHLKIALIAHALLLLISCAPENEPPSDFTVAATFYPVWLAAANIMHDIDGVSLKLLTPHGAGCLHEHQLTPAELESIKNADLVLALGGMEEFLPRIQRTYPDIKLVEVGDSSDKHCWIFVNEYIKTVNYTGSAIINADPDRADDYERNIRAYIEDLSKLAAEMNLAMVNINDSPVIMFHEGFDSWRLAYGINIIATVGSTPGNEPTPREFAGTLDLAKSMNVKVLFVDSHYSGAAAHTVARETGAKVYELNLVASGTERLDYYQRAMRMNVETVLAALGEE